MDFWHENHGYRGGSELSETLDNMILFLNFRKSTF